MKIAFTWDDGALEDQKLFALHERYGLPAIFFVPTRNCEGRRVLTAQMIRQAASPLIRFGGHTASHRYLTDVPAGEWDEELLSNKKWLEDILGQEVPHFCLPGGKYTPDILERAFRYYATVRTADTMNFRSGGKLVKPTFHFYLRGFKSLAGNAVRQRSWREVVLLLSAAGKDYFDVFRSLIVYESKRIPEAQIVIWGHSWEIEQLSLWDRLEDLFRWLSDSYPSQCVGYESLFL